MKKRSRETSLPDITPLIDVVFLLLIFFMISTVFKKDELALMLNLPKTENGKAVDASKKIVVIELSTGQVAVDGTKTTLKDIQKNLAKIRGKTTPVDVRIDRDVKYDRVMSLLDSLKKQNLNNLSLISGQ